jgi:hypothetical protein
MMQSSLPLLVRQLSWAQASLDLCLDMERNQSDARFASISEKNEIVYTFDESVFELFVGGFDESNGVYQDRRRAVGIFNTSEWRETPSIPEAAEAHRIELNRQTAILASEWLFSGRLPAMKEQTIYISTGHLKELRTRWQVLIDHFRQSSRTSKRARGEREKIRHLLEDRTSPYFFGRIAQEAADQEPTKYIEEQSEPLRSDLRDFWKALMARRSENKSSIMEDFWRFAFSRRLALELSSMHTIGPLAQLVRINAEIAGRLRLVEHAGKIDTPLLIPSSERQPFWRDRIRDEIQRRSDLGIRSGRSDGAQANDAATLAVIQALANSAAKRGEGKRFVLVTADSLLIDIYRDWHCHSALDFEPFIVRSVRQFAPLLNAVSMLATTEGAQAADTSERRDIFPALQAAIDPFLLSLNLSPTQPYYRRVLEAAPEGDDAVRWPREMFALRLRRLLEDYRTRSLRSEADAEKRLREGVADRRLFLGAHFEKLAYADKELKDVAERGRQIERSAIGLGFEPLCTRLEAIKITADILDAFAGSDDAALAAYIQDMVDELGSTNLHLRVRSLDIAKELNEIVSGDDFRSLGARRVPLALEIRFTEAARFLSIAGEAEAMIGNAIERGSREAQRGRRRPSFDRDLQDGNLGQNGGFRLYALYACIALRLGNWSLAHHCAEEALKRVQKFCATSKDDILELEYLLALCIRFQLGAGVIRDATASDVSLDGYHRARKLLLDTIDGHTRFKSFTVARAAAELVALLVFGSIWSLAPQVVAAENYPLVPEDLFQSELPFAWELCRKLRSAADEGLFGSSEPARIEVLEQAKVNSAAVYCFAALFAQKLDSRSADILGDAEMRNWLAKFDSKGRRGDSVPPITDFYNYWYRRLAGGESAELVQRHFDLDLRIDILASRIFVSQIG